jgi:hypothetical protein
LNSPEDVKQKTVVQPWSPWVNESAGTKEIFCWQKFIPTMEQEQSLHKIKCGQVSTHHIPIIANRQKENS